MPGTELRGARVPPGREATTRDSGVITRALPGSPITGLHPLSALSLRAISERTANLQSQYTGLRTFFVAATPRASLPFGVLLPVFQKQVARSIAISGFK